MIDFSGDGRKKLTPPEGALGPKPLAVTRAEARSIIQMFETRRNSTHSRNCGTLWIILAHCEQARLNFKLVYHPGHGAFVALIDPLA
jgi:hypothetical protein